MKRNTLLKIAALATSLGIAGAYVAHRASARSDDAPSTSPTPANAPVAPPAEKPGDVVPVYSATPVTPAAEEEDPAIFYGSKSAPMIGPGEFRPRRAKPAPKPPPSDGATPPQVAK